MGCAATCLGYELEADLDFNTDTGSDSGGAAVIDADDDYHNLGSGWEPLGDSGPNPFGATFDGNNHTISNLFINVTGNSDNYIGLFGQLGGGSVRRVHLVGANVTGNNDVGALVGHISLGTVSHSSSSGAVSGVEKVGGLVGTINSSSGTVEYSRSSATVTGTYRYVGGLVGRNAGYVRVSYATGAVTGLRYAGGLVGYSTSPVSAAYATGAVNATRATTAYAGGLFGWSEGSMHASYSTGAVTSVSGHAAGLVASNGYGVSYDDSYWDVTTSGIADDNDPETGVGKTTMELQSPTQTDGYAGIYADWNIDIDRDSNVDDPWDFGTSSEYPALKADSDGDGAATAYEFGRQGRSAPVVQAPAKTDYDTDGDGLIEVDSLAKLNAIRWDLDGNGASTNAGYATAFPTPETGMGCPITATDADDNDCLGYELTADLDFNTDTGSDSGGVAVIDSDDDYHNSGAGWEPIGDGISASLRYHAIFDGGGHTISNLFINRLATYDVGLFGATGTSGKIRNVGLEGANVTGSRLGNTGALIGTAYGTVDAAYSTGSVTGTNQVGGLVGYMFSSGSIQRSYSTASVTASGNNAGGLVALSGVGSGRGIRGSYATGAVSGTNYVGGLVGHSNQNIIASYARGAVNGTGSNVGGLVGMRSARTITNSYWDVTTSTQADDGDAATGEGKTTSDLATPQANGSGSAIYANWNLDLDSDSNADDPWDFGTASEYPALKADFNRDSVKSAVDGDFGRQPRAAPVVTVDYDTDGDNLIEVSTLAQLNAIRYDLDGNGDSTHATYTGAFPNAASGMGCAATCLGYELTTDLDFNTDTGSDSSGAAVIDSDDDYNSGSGWAPIGGRFTAIFNGNGHVIKNLFINRSGGAGLFNSFESRQTIRNLGLENVNITGGDSVGPLASTLYSATVERVYATGSVTGRQNTGGLVGFAAYSFSLIVNPTLRNSYSRVAVTGTNHVGGLVGFVNSGLNLTNSYFAGTISGTGADVGSLVGRALSVTATRSYWDGDRASGAGGRPAGASRTTSALQTPTGATGIYSAWATATWDFGTASEYPALKYDTNGNGAATWEEFGNQVRAAPANAPPAFSAGADTTPNVAEGATAVGNYAATDPESDSLTYAVTGTDASYFGISGTGALTLNNAANHETKSSYSVSVTVHDGKDAASAADTSVDATLDLTVTVDDTLEPPTAPTNLQVFSAVNGLRVTWTAPVMPAAKPPLSDYDVQHSLRTSGAGVNPVTWGAWVAFNHVGTGTTATITGLTVSSTYRVQVLAKNAEGSSAWTSPVTGVPAAPAVTVDYDTDDDGLIEVDSLDKLNAVRWDLDGNGASANAGYATAFPTPATGMGCPITATDADDNDCIGYELTADLDFDQSNDNRITAADAAWWNSGAGWAAIGTWGSPFNATFDGGGHAISHLYIRASGSNVGLFGSAGTSGVIRNLGLENVNITGGDSVGPLASTLYSATVERVYATGSVTGRQNTGGLVGFAAYSFSLIVNPTLRNSYSRVAVTGTNHVGGLVGFVNSGLNLTNSYFAGTISGTGADVGSLVGRALSVTAARSYWDGDRASGAGGRPAGASRTTSALQTPTGATGIYSGWSAAIWDFGTASQYPALKYDTNGNGAATWEEFGNQVRAAQVDYDRDDDGLIDVDSLAKLHAVRWDLDGNGASANAGYAAAFPNPETGMGCPVTTADADDNDCTGYELTADLDFDTHGNDDTVTAAAAAYWNGGSGWDPIGSWSSPLATTFDGAGHAISNLFINRGSTDYLGLFSVVHNGGRIRNLGLEGVKITGRDKIGPVAGGTYAAGAVEAVYVTGEVSGREWVGGLIGEHYPSASLRNSYSTASVTGRYAGGMLGYVPNGMAAVYYSYARGVVSGQDSGGLLFSSAVEFGITGHQTYWDTQTSGQATSNGGTGQTTSNLKTPTDTTTDMDASTVGNQNIYSSWPAATWDFGTAIQYPALKYDTNKDGRATWQEFGRQPRSAANGTPTLTPGYNESPTVAEGARLVGNYPATDPDGDTLTYGVSGTDGAAFSFTGDGVLSLKSAADHERKDSYSVTVWVMDSKDAEGNDDAAWDDSIDLTVRVVDDTSEAPGAPTGLTATPIAEGLRVTWTAPVRTDQPPVTGYGVEYKLSAATGWTAHPHAGTGTTARITGLTAGSTYNVRVRAVSHENPSGWTSANGVPAAAGLVVDYDTDDDGLIEIKYLEQLNAMRWDEDGDGSGGGSDYDAAFPDAAPGMGCPSDCTGYELEADLNFDTKRPRRRRLRRRLLERRHGLDALLVLRDLRGEPAHHIQPVRQPAGPGLRGAVLHRRHPRGRGRVRRNPQPGAGERGRNRPGVRGRAGGPGPCLGAPGLHHRRGDGGKDGGRSGGRSPRPD